MQETRHSISLLILVAAGIGFSAKAEAGADSFDHSSETTLPRILQIGLAMEPVDDGVRVVLAPSDQPAGQAGIREGDVIRHMDGEPVASQAEVVAKLRADRPSEIRFDLVRNGAATPIARQAQTRSPRSTSPAAFQASTSLPTSRHCPTPTLLDGQWHHRGLVGWWAGMTSLILKEVRSGID